MKKATLMIRLRRRQLGLSLFECLASIAILSFGLVGVIGCLTASLLSNQKASDIELATAECQSTIEDMRSRGFGSITYEEFPASEAVTGLPSGLRTIVITDDYSGNFRLKHVSVRVSWRGAGGGNANVYIETVINNRAGHTGSG